MPDRRFSDEEVAAILERAANAEATGSLPVRSGDGMTLAEIQAAGREAGIPPELIRSAAMSLARQGESTAQRFLGMPIGVGRIVHLGRKLSDDEWDRLVVDLRETFNARGAVRRDSSLRQWTNGNLQVLVEPTSDGDRVRMRTIKGSARRLTAVGVGALAVSLAMLVAPAIAGVSASATSSLAGLALIGVGAIAAGVGQLPGWARRRRQQMEDVASRLEGGSER
jgi:hypothetical protein